MLPIMMMPNQRPADWPLLQFDLRQQNNTRFFYAQQNNLATNTINNYIQVVPMQPISTHPGEPIVTSEHAWVTLEAASNVYLKLIESKTTRVTYEKNLKYIFKWFISKDMTLLEFSKVQKQLGSLILMSLTKNDPSILSNRPGGLEKCPQLCTATTQNIAATYQSFTSFLEIYTNKMIEYQKPCKSGVQKTFRKINDKTKSTIFSKDQLKLFFATLKSSPNKLISYFIAVLQVKGCRRINEVCSVKVEDIDWIDGTIGFYPEKKRMINLEKILVYFEMSFMSELKAFIGPKTKGYVFPNFYNGKKKRGYISCEKVFKDYAQVFKSLNIKCVNTTHSLRATGICLLLERGLSLDKVLEITAHSSVDIVNYYNKKENRSKLYTKDTNVLDLILSEPLLLSSQTVLNHMNHIEVI